MIYGVDYFNLKTGCWVFKFFATVRERDIFFRKISHKLKKNFKTRGPIK